MSTTTPNLTLTLYDSSTDQIVTFATFRAVWGGTATTSNFYRIDTWAGTVNSAITTLQNQRGAIPVSASYISANYYEATVASITSYVTGMTILLKLDTDSAGTVTMNINALGTKSVTKVNSSGTIVNIAGAELQSNRYYLFTYDGTQWVWVNATSADQIYHGGTTGNFVVIASDGSISDSVAPADSLASTIYNATGKTTPSKNDKIGITDSGASNVLKSITYNNFIKSLIQSSTVTTTDVSALENVTYNLTITGLTANRNFILPAPTSSGSILRVNILDGNSTYFIIVKGDTGVSINGGSTATEFHRLQVAGRSLTFISSSTTNWQCVDGLVENNIQLVNYTNVAPYSISGSFTGFLPIAFPFKLKQATMLYYANPTTDGSNYWTVSYVDLVPTTTATFNATTGSAWTTSITTSFSKVNYVVSDGYFASQITTGAGSPGSIFAYSQIKVWLC